MRLRRALCTAALTVATALSVTAPAQAAPGDAVAAGDAGSIAVQRHGELVEVGPIAACRTDGPATGDAGEVTVAGVVSFTDSTSTCTVDELGEVATVEVRGGRFRFDALTPYGGPRIRMANYVSKCATTPTGSTSSVGVTGLTGVTVPEQLPANHVVTVPGTTEDAPPIAAITFNEMTTPSPADGSMTVHAMHVRLFPRGGGPASGDVHVGTVRCAPAA